jgi:hypothetical protein
MISADKYLDNAPKPCPKCGAITTLSQTGRSVYANPCGCRLGQWQLIKKPVLKTGDQTSLF